MALVPFDPFRSLENWGRDFDLNIWPSTFHQHFSGPRVDVQETADEVVAYCEVPGLEKKEDIKVKVHDNVLQISGSISRANEVREEQMFRKERFMGRFQRSITLPSSVSSEGTKAVYKNGILEVRMPKTAHASKHIDIDFH